MECKHAYLEKDIDYVLCDKEPKPNRSDRPSLFHAACAHQAHCPKENCHKLTANWTTCVKLAERNQDAYDAIFRENMPTHDEAPQKAPRRARRPKADE